MSIISVQRLGKYYGAQDVFANIECSLAHGDKVALVGPNGAGKTTLLRILLGLEEPSAGQVLRAKGLRMGYLPQKPEFPSQQTLYAEMLGVFAALRAKQQALEALTQRMAEACAPSLLLMDEYAQAEREFEVAGGYTYEARIRRVLSGLGFGPETYLWPIAALSSGQVTRALLARLLLQEPDLLVLDEPTNYLDLDALEWLEAYLQAWPQSLLVVSHDRYFLDKVATRVWELDHGALEAYRGNYSSYLVQRVDRAARRQAEYERQQADIAKTQDFIQRYRAGQRSKEARGRQTRLDRLERLEAPRASRILRLNMTTNLRAGDNVLMSDGVTLGYPALPDALLPARGDDMAHALFSSGPFLVLRGQRVALLGPNGSGKTTFLRTILGQLEPLAGRIRLGASVRPGYLPQKQQFPDGNQTVLGHILAVSNLEIEPARTFLGRFLFSGDDVFKPLGILSGGELSRLALATLTLQGANFLVLDEPTTHLDVASQEVLQDVLAHFDGTLLFVSHDRYLVDALATHVWVIRDGQMRQHEGDYSGYIQAVALEGLAVAEREESVAARGYEERRRRERQAQRAERERTRRIAALEADIHQLERQLEHVTSLLNLASSSQDVARVQTLGREYQDVEETLAQRMEEWERCTSAESA